MSSSMVKGWFILHKWSSLVCSIFLLVICLTGLPLVFSEEIGNWPNPPTHYLVFPTDAPRANLDRLVSIARSQYPEDVVMSVFVDDDEPQVYVWMAPSFLMAKEKPKSVHFIRFDARTGQLLSRSVPADQQSLSFVGWMLRLHRNLFAGLPGELFLGGMGLLFLTAILSGVVLYGPFMRKLEFGAVRAERGRRLKWLDLHNLLGIVTLAWMFVLGTTGVINEMATPLFALWQRTEVRAILAPWQGKPALASAEVISPQIAWATAQRAAPETIFTSIGFPGANNNSSLHYLLWGHGRSALTSRLYSPVLVDARTGELTAIIEMPWYLRALEISRPLHFGDYGGLPLKIIWAFLDVLTIVVLGSGLYLWIARRKQSHERLKKLIQAHADASSRATSSRATKANS